MSFGTLAASSSGGGLSTRLGRFLAVGLVCVGCTARSSAQTDEGGSTGAGGHSGVGGAAPDAAVGSCGSSGTIEAGVFETGAEVLAACQACELAADPTAVPSCDPAFLTAIKDPTGAPVGWGIDTLATVAERAAGAALLHCLDVNDCAANATNMGPGDNAALGCFCGAGVAPVDCIGGQGVHGACLLEYEAAATASPGGPAACASLSAFSAFVSTATAGYAGPIALAGNIKRCAVNAPCAVCGSL